MAATSRIGTCRWVAPIMRMGTVDPSAETVDSLLGAVEKSRMLGPR